MALGRGSQLHRVRCSAPDPGVVRNKASKFKESVGVTVDPECHHDCGHWHAFPSFYDNWTKPRAWSG